MISRLIATVIVIGFWQWLEFSFNTGATLVVGSAAGSQFDSSDKSYIMFSLLNQAVTQFGELIGAGFGIILLIIWVPFIMKMIKTSI